MAYEKAIETFIQKHKNRNSVMAILLTGSYALGMQRPDSDIDIRIVLMTERSINLKGAEEIDGYLFSYLIMDVGSYYEQMNTQFRHGSKLEARNLQHAKLIYGSPGNPILSELLQRSEDIIHSDFAPLGPEAIMREKIRVRTHYEKIMNSDTQSMFFSCIYYYFLVHIYMSYTYIMGYEHITDGKLEKFFTSKSFLEKYMYKDIEDPLFVEHFLNSVKTTDLKALEKLYTHYENVTQEGQLDYNNFEIKM